MNNHQKYWAALVGMGYVLFLVCIFLFSVQPFCDEPYYLENVVLFQKYGFGDEFFLLYKGPAGPTYAWVHFLFEPLTGLHTLPTRLVNVLISVLVVGVYCWIIKDTFGKSTLYNGFNLLIVPTTYVATGFAITNMPSMLFFLLSVLLVYKILHNHYSTRVRLVLNILLAVFLALTVLGRQTYLPVLGIILAYGFMVNQYKLVPTIKQLYGVLLALLPVGYVFYVWKGIQPASTLFVQGGWRVDHLFFAFGYAGIFALFLTPQFFYRLKSKTEFILLAVAFGLIYFFNSFYSFTEKVPLKNFVNKFMGPGVLQQWSVFASSILLLFCFYFGFSLIYRLYQNRNNTFYLFVGCSAITVLCTSIKITHLFSALYTYQVMPLVLLLLIPYEKFDAFKIVRSAVLVVLGFLNYYFYA